MSKNKLDNDEIEIDDILGSLQPEKKKKVNGKKKGNRVELQLCKKLTSHFGKDFSRSVGSGNRSRQVTSMPEHAKKTFLGDICAPEEFLWVIECKGGYDDDVDFSSVFDGGCSRIDAFIKQSLEDARQSNRKPIVMWKRSRKPWVAMLRVEDFSMGVDVFDVFMLYKNWYIVSLDILLETTSNEFWFNK